MEINKQPTPKVIYATLGGNVDTQMVQRLFNACSLAVNDGVETVHLLMHSNGGQVSDGIGIYNFLRKLPMNIIAYNGGTVASIAVIIFLAAKQRKASGTATFMIHRTHFGATVPVTSDIAESIGNMLKIDDGRTDGILQEHIKMPPDKWATHQKVELAITAREALDYGLIHEIADFQVPPGNHLFNLNV